MKTVKMLLLSSSALLLLVGCGSGTDSSNWGIDNGKEIELSHGPLNAETGLYRCELDDAMLIEPQSVVTPLDEDTQLRVWHFKNSDEYACTLKGKAMVTQSVEG